MSHAPEKTLIYHITDVENLPSILAENGLHSDAVMVKRSPEVIVGYDHIKKRRLKLGEEHGEDAPVAEFQEGVAEDVAEEAGQVRAGDDAFAIHLHVRAAEQLDAARKSGHALVG